MTPQAHPAARGTPRRITLGSLPVDAVTREQALDFVEKLVQSGEGGAVFTPNVDHVVLAEENDRMRQAYARASLSLVDGMPLLWASHLLGDPLPEKVSGSDFTPLILGRAAQRGWRVFFLGGGPGVATLARDRLSEQVPALQVVGVDAPRIEVNDPDVKQEQLVRRIEAARPHLVLVALGAPKQEIWIDLVREKLKPAVLLAVGASLDFLAGTTPRAPRWMSRSGLEWLFRLGLEPRRLWQRYLLRDPKFLMIVGRALRHRNRQAR